MPIQHIFRDDWNLIISIHDGDISDEELFASYQELFTDPRFSHSHRRLVDLGLTRSTGTKEHEFRSL